MTVINTSISYKENQPLNDWKYKSIKSFWTNQFAAPSEELSKHGGFQLWWRQWSRGFSGSYHRKQMARGRFKTRVTFKFWNIMGNKSKWRYSRKSPAFRSESNISPPTWPTQCHRRIRPASTPTTLLIHLHFQSTGFSVFVFGQVSLNWIRSDVIKINGTDILQVIYLFFYYFSLEWMVDSIASES